MPSDLDFLNPPLPRKEPTSAPVNGKYMNDTQLSAGLNFYQNRVPQVMKMEPESPSSVNVYNANKEEKL